MYGGRAQPRWIASSSSTTHVRNKEKHRKCSKNLVDSETYCLGGIIKIIETCPFRPLLGFWMQSNKESENRIRQASASLNFPAARELLPLNTLPKWSCPLSTVEHSCHTGGQDVTVPRFYNVMSRIFHALTNKSTTPAPVGILKKNITPITPTYGVCNIPALYFLTNRPATKQI